MLNLNQNIIKIKNKGLYFFNLRNVQTKPNYIVCCAEPIVAAWGTASYQVDSTFVFFFLHLFSCSAFNADIPVFLLPNQPSPMPCFFLCSL